jgi:hypothetical protein
MRPKTLSRLVKRYATFRSYLMTVSTCSWLIRLIYCSFTRTLRATIRSSTHPYLRTINNNFPVSFYIKIYTPDVWENYRRLSKYMCIKFNTIFCLVKQIRISRTLCSEQKSRSSGQLCRFPDANLLSFPSNPPSIFWDIKSKLRLLYFFTLTLYLVSH